MPAFARVPESALERISWELVSSEDTSSMLDSAFDRFEREQPCLAAHIGDILDAPLDERALALGYFLALAIWLAFERTHGDSVDLVSAESVRATQLSLEVDEELRRADANEALDSEDVISMEQPALMSFIHENVRSSLTSDNGDMDMDHLDTIYRVVLVELLCLSYAVTQPAGFPMGLVEAYA